MPEGFAHPDGDTRLWIPLSIDPANAPLGSFGANGIGRSASSASAHQP